MSNPCNARLLTNSFVVGGVTLYDTEECQRPATKHVWVEDAEARMFICGQCIRRWLTKNHTPSKWYGWFDCQTPPLTPAAESPFYMDVLRKTYGNKPISELRKELLKERIEKAKQEFKEAQGIPNIISSHQRLMNLRKKLERILR